MDEVLYDIAHPHSKSRYRRNCSNGILRVEASREGKADQILTPLCFERKFLPFKTGVNIPDLKISAQAETKGDDLKTTGKFCRELLAVWIVDIDDRNSITPLFRHLLKEELLRIEVFLHRAMVVEVILREVHEDADTEGNPLGASLLQSVRGRLHCDCLAAIFHHRGENFLHLKGTRRGVRGILILASIVNLDGANHSRLHHRLIEQIVDKMSYGCFSVRTGHSHTAHLGTRVSRELGGKSSKRLARAIDLDPKPGIIGRSNSLRDDGSRFYFDHLIKKIVPINLASTHGDKDRILLDLLAVISHRRDIDILDPKAVGLGDDL